MTLLYSVAAGETIQAADVNQFKKMLEGSASYTSTFVLVSTAGTNFIMKLGDAAGANKFAVQDSAGVEQWSINSDGGITGGALAPSTFVLPVSASPSQTTEGQAVWDSDDDVLTVGTGAATKRLGLTRGAGSSATATAELVYDTTANQLKVWNGAASVAIKGEWTLVANGDLGAVPSLDLASLSGYKRYRLSVAAIYPPCTPGTMTMRINAEAGAYYQTARSQIVAGAQTLTSETGTTSATLAVFASATGAAGAGKYEFEFGMDTQSSSIITWLYRLSRWHPAVGHYFTTGAGALSTAYASITEIALTFDITLGTGHYILEGSNS